MSDGRETLAPLNNEQTFLANLVTDLTHQAIDATTGHAQAAQPPTAGQLAQIVDFEMGLFSAQLRDELQITNVRGLNDDTALGSPVSFVGHCTSCHDTPDVGNHSLPLPLDIGTSHSALSGMEGDPAIAAAVAQLSMPDLPVYLINGCPSPFAPGQPESFYTTYPGKALITGECSDFNRVKGPVLRGLAARAPYFHNGAAADLNEVVNFYDQRFSMQLTEEQKADLVAFLNSL